MAAATATAAAAAAAEAIMGVCGDQTQEMRWEAARACLEDLEAATAHGEDEALTRAVVFARAVRDPALGRERAKYLAVARLDDEHSVSAWSCTML